MGPEDIMWWIMEKAGGGLFRHLLSNTNEPPDEINALKHDLVASQGELIALKIGMRQLVARSEGSERDVKESISNLCRHFRDNQDQAIKSFSDTYPDYDLEMVKLLIQNIAESLESFLPIRLSGHASITVGGSATATVNKRDGSTAAE